MWPDTGLIDLLDLEVPIIQAPMAGSDGADLAAAVSAAGGLGSVGAAAMPPEGVVDAAVGIRRQTDRPFNLNFFCHRLAERRAGAERQWLDRLRPYFAEFDSAPPESLEDSLPPFGEALCDLVTDIKPAVVSFHFGLPDDHLVARLKGAGCRILSTATTPAEAAILEARGVDAVIAHGAEAGGHRGVFAEDWRAGSGQIGTMALVPQVVDAVTVPVIAAGGIADGRAIAASFALGASAVQIGTAFLFTPEAAASPVHRVALREGGADSTVVTNVYGGRPARALGNRFVRETRPMNPDMPDFPLPFSVSGPLSKAAQEAGSGGFGAAWAGQAVALGREMPAGDLVRDLADSALLVLNGFSAPS